jgi:hypothetical protein
MMDMKQWIEMRIAAALKELDGAKHRYRMFEIAATAIENGHEPDSKIQDAYYVWRGLQPKDSPHA